MAGKTNPVEPPADAAFPLGGMHLEQTLFCGQSFSWEKQADGRFLGTAGANPAVVWQQGDTLHVARPDAAPLRPGEQAFWRRYFALDVDYPALLAGFGKSKKLARCVACAPGLRVLRQPFFDTLLSFIISQNNNIPRITGIVQRLRQGFGPQLCEGVYGFPSAQALAAQTEAGLAPLRAGWRAGYLLDAAAKVAGGYIKEEELRAAGDEEARKMLMEIKGVGPKVADCVLLFSLGRSAVVPMDVWMKRAMGQVFPAGMPACAKGYEGIAQQYVFHWARQNLEKGSGAPSKPAAKTAARTKKPAEKKPPKSGK